MDQKTAQKILKDVKNVYKNIAPDFSATRSRTWPDIAALVKKYVRSGDKVLDLGCGNGRLSVDVRKQKGIYLGLDNSLSLLKIARQKYPQAEFQFQDMTKLKVKNNQFDFVFAISTIHHIPSAKLRLRLFKKIYQTLKPGGRLVMSNWYLFTPHYSKYIIKTGVLRAFHQTDLDPGDAFVPWQNKYFRYYHSFTKEEVKSILESVGFKIEQNAYYDTPRDRTYLLTVAKKA